MLPITPIARVVVNTVRASASPASFDTGLILTSDASFDDSRRLLSYASGAEAAAGLTELGFTSASEVYKSAVKYFAASPSPARLLVSCHPSAESLSEALDAVLELSASFYGVYACDTLTASEWLAFAQHVESLPSPLVLFVPVDSTAAEGTLARLYAAGLKRALPFWCDAPSDTAAVMGTAMGLELSHRASAFALCYKTVSGIEPADLTQGQVEAIKGMNGNVYVSRGGNRLLLENGSVASGLRYDEVLYVDRIADDLQAAAVSLLADNPDRLPQTDDSTAQFICRFTGILMDYTARGILASGRWRGPDTGPVKNGEVVENGFRLWADSYDDQPDADCAAHKAVPVQAALCLAGSIESIVITVDVQI